MKILQETIRPETTGEMAVMRILPEIIHREKDKEGTIHPTKAIHPVRILQEVRIIPRAKILLGTTHPVMGILRMIILQGTIPPATILLEIHPAVEEIGLLIHHILHIHLDRMVEAMAAEAAVVEISHLIRLILRIRHIHQNPQGRTTRAGRDLDLDPGPEAIG